MHQLPRASPRSATPASNPTTNPERTNNSRDPPPAGTRSSFDLASYTERVGPESASMANRNEAATASSQDRERTRVNQIVQNFHTKAALLICSSRANLPPAYTQNGDIRQNRWFNIVIDETDVLMDDLLEWRRADVYEDRLRPLVIEIFVDTTHLTKKQLLVVKDETGQRFDVANALASSADSSPHPAENGGRYCEVVLERWTLELGDPKDYTSAELNDNLPNVYKKGVVVFRTLYTFLRLLPASKLYRKLQRQTTKHQALQLKFRIRQGLGLARDQKDSLFAPLCPSELADDDIVEHHVFHPLVTPVGPLSCSLDYRKTCLFDVADTEALISDHFYGLDEGIPGMPVGRSLPGDRSEKARDRYSSTAVPATTTTRERPRALLGGAYGSLGTFHALDRRGSPVSELRQRALEDDEQDDMSRVDQIRDEEGIPRRKSVNYIANPPFKAGSLTSSPKPSPRPSPRPSPSPSTSLGRNEGYLTKYGSSTAASSKRNSLNTLPQQQLRTPPIPNDVPSSGSTSPKPAPARYSSSFANRSKRFTSQSSKAAESSTSSGRGSSDSKEKSEHMNEINQGSTGSGHTDDQDITSFISELEKHKDIKFQIPPTSRDNVINLTKYTNMRDPSTQLAEEMSSSSLIQTSSTPSSRRLSNVPGLSTSSSPQRVLTHTPHVRSRLSTHSVAEEPSAASAASGEGSDSPKAPHLEEDEDEDEPFIFPHYQNDLT